METFQTSFFFMSFFEMDICFPIPCQYGWEFFRIESSAFIQERIFHQEIKRRKIIIYQKDLQNARRILKTCGGKWGNVVHLSWKVGFRACSWANTIIMLIQKAV